MSESFAALFEESVRCKDSSKRAAKDSDMCFLATNRIPVAPLLLFL
jgi:hypothetical protein